MELGSAESRARPLKAVVSGALVRESSSLPRAPKNLDWVVERVREAADYRDSEALAKALKLVSKPHVEKNPCVNEC